MKSKPEVIELDEADLESKLDQIEAALGAEMAQPFRNLLRWYACLLELLREKKLSIRRLQKMLFGASTERTSSVLSSAGSSAQGENTSAENAQDPSACHPEIPSMDENQGHGSDSPRDQRAPAPQAARSWPNSRERLHRLRAGGGDPRIAVSGRLLSALQ